MENVHTLNWRVLMSSCPSLCEIQLSVGWGGVLFLVNGAICRTLQSLWRGHEHPSRDTDLCRWSALHCWLTSILITCTD